MVLPVSDLDAVTVTLRERGVLRTKIRTPDALWLAAEANDGAVIAFRSATTYH